MLVYKKIKPIMENQEPQVENTPQFSPEMIAEMKRQAKELAVRQVLERRNTPQPSIPQPLPNQQRNQNIQTRVVRRSLTLAEILLMFTLSCGLVFGLQSCWNVTSEYLPRIEIKMQK
tara:strand:+ start:1381 stop:1731 length:351 start_codon:yes stop_codon:yes gene_type:complete